MGKTRTSFRDQIRLMGVRQYLNKTRTEHNNVGYAMFRVMIRVKTSRYNMHKIMGLSRRHIDDLIAVYEEEQGNK